MKIIVTGASGLLGSHLCQQGIIKGHSILAVSNANYLNLPECRSVQLNLVNAELAELRKFKPDLVIHAAAITDVDLCEKQPEQAYALHGTSTQRLVELCKTVDSHLIYVSTDSIFGSNLAYHSESEEPSPLNEYARSKLVGENYTFEFNNSLVVRTTFYGLGVVSRPGYMNWLLRSFQAKGTVPGFTDFFFSPIPVSTVAKALIELGELRAKGLLHIAGDCRISKFDFSQLFALKFGFSEQQVVPVKMSDMSLMAKRPSDCSLAINKAKAILNLELPDTQKGLDIAHKLYIERQK